MASKASLTNRRILITGASSGIGRQFAISLAKENDLLLVGRDEKELSTTGDLVKNRLGNKSVEVFATDLTIESQRNELIGKAKSFHPDTLIFSAGGGEFALFLDRQWEGLKNEISLNILNNIHLTQALLPIALEQAKKMNRWAQVVFVSSHSAYMRVPRFSVYASAKSFLYSFGLTLMQELKKEPIKIMVLCPGATATKFSQRAAIPSKMVSKPCSPQRVVEQALRHFGENRLVITNNFDKLLYFASKVLPLSFFDGVVAWLQNIILSRRAKESSMMMRVKSDKLSQ